MRSWIKSIKKASVFSLTKKRPTKKGQQGRYVSNYKFVICNNGQQIPTFYQAVFIYTNIGVVTLFLLACIAPYLNPQKWWLISFLGLVFPFLLVIVLIYLLWWLILWRRYALISGMAIVMGIKSISVFFSFHNSGSFRYNKEPGTIRVVSWNVARFIEMKRNSNAGSLTRLRMMEQIQQQDADVLCFQEFFHSVDPTWYANIDHIRESSTIHTGTIHMMPMATIILQETLFFPGFQSSTAESFVIQDRLCLMHLSMRI